MVEDLRNQSHWRKGGASWNNLFPQLEPTRFDLSETIEFSNLDELAQLRANPPHPIIEGLMLKRKDSPLLVRHGPRARGSNGRGIHT